VMLGGGVNNAGGADEKIHWCARAKIVKFLRSWRMRLHRGA